jgi:hypothetical protein
MGNGTSCRVAIARLTRTQPRFGTFCGESIDDHAFCALNARNDEKKVHPILLL